MAPSGGVQAPLAGSQAVTRVRLRRALCSLSGGLSGGMRACVPDTVSTHKLRLASSGEGILPSYRDREHHAGCHVSAPPTATIRASTCYHMCHVPPHDTTCMHHIHAYTTNSTPQPPNNRSKRGSKQGQKEGHFGGSIWPWDPAQTSPQTTPSGGSQTT